MGGDLLATGLDQVPLDDSPLADLLLLERPDLNHNVPAPVIPDHFPLRRVHALHARSGIRQRLGAALVVAD
jgi:hypothetical protein